MALALVTPTAVLTHQAPGGALASATLLPELQLLLQRAGAALGRLDAIAFGRGPGAFTGLRTSCAVAQGLAFGLGRPVLPIDSLLIVAEDARVRAQGLHAGATPFDVGVAMDARMDEVYAARFRHGPAGWQPLQAPGLFSLDALASAWGDVAVHGPDGGVRAWLAGSALAVYGERLPLPVSARWVATEHDRAAALARLAAAAWAAGEAVDAAQALPLYLRDRVALTIDERATRKFAK
jgi:tRNA threonylcarbamoyladenosine biosynthesis protein TsaB